MKKYLVINIIAMAAMFVGLINAVAFKEVWVLLGATMFLVILTVYTIKEKRKLKQNQSQNQGSG